MTDLLMRRLYNQHVAGASLRKVEDVVSWLGAVQSQDYLGAKWSIGQRVLKGTDAGVDQAFNEGRILRTHVLRPTWHFVRPEDIRWMLRLTAPRVHALNAYYCRQDGLDKAVLARTRTIIAKALDGGRQCTRKELAPLLTQAGLGGAGRRIAYIMMNAELEGLICSGALRGKQHTYALLEERVPPVQPLPRDEALAELTRRFFTGHAPATLRHYIWWSGLSVTDAKAGLAMVQEQLARETVDGQTFWSGTGPIPRRPIMAAYLIPGYDESLTGYRDLAVPDIARAKGIKPKTDGSFPPIILGGKRAGTWRRVISGGRVVIHANLFARLGATESRALDAVVRQYGTFLNLPAALH